MLLAPPPPADLPADALLVRLRARRAQFDLSGGPGAAATPPEFLTWLYPRLGRPLRAAMLPWLEVEAMHLLLIALRYRLNESSMPPGLLSQPWLAAELPELLDRSEEPRLAVTRLERWLVADYRFAAGLAAGYLRQGPGWVEQQLAAGILGQGLAQARAPAVRMALGFLADLRNLLAVLRHWRWQLRAPPPLLPGGELDAGVLGRAWAAGDQETLSRLIARMSEAAPVALEPRAAERQLLGGLTLRLRRAGRDPLGSAVVVDTLWRCRIAARNRALRQAAGEEDGLLAAALL